MDDELRTLIDRVDRLESLLARLLEDGIGGIRGRVVRVDGSSDVAVGTRGTFRVLDVGGVESGTTATFTATGGTIRAVPIRDAAVVSRRYVAIAVDGGWVVI